MEIKPYKRKVNYYETDRMEIVHHSNYIRYFEEARIDFMNQIGCGVKMMEDIGLIIPNVDAYAKYLRSLRFDDTFEVSVTVKKFTGVRMVFEYELVKDGEIYCTGHTTHCFVNEAYKPVTVKHSHPEIYERLSKAAEL